MNKIPNEVNYNFFFYSSLYREQIQQIIGNITYKIYCKKYE